MVVTFESCYLRRNEVTISDRNPMAMYTKYEGHVTYRYKVVSILENNPMELYSTNQLWDDGIPVTKTVELDTFTEQFEVGDIIRMCIVDNTWIYFFIENKSTKIWCTSRLSSPTDWVSKLMSTNGMMLEVLGDYEATDAVEVESKCLTEDDLTDLIDDDHFRKSLIHISRSSIRGIGYTTSGGPGNREIDTVLVIGVSYHDSDTEPFLIALRNYFSGNGFTNVKVTSVLSSSEYNNKPHYTWTSAMGPANTHRSIYLI